MAWIQIAGQIVSVISIGMLAWTFYVCEPLTHREQPAIVRKLARRAIIAATIGATAANLPIALRMIFV